MRILVSHMSGYPEHEGNLLRKAFAALGHDVDLVTTPSRMAPGDGSRFADPGHAHTVSLSDFSSSVAEDPSLFLYCEPLGLIPLGLEAAAFPTACFLVDLHRHLPSRILLAKFFDHVFLAQRDYVKAFRDAGFHSVHWMPLACDPDLHRANDEPRTLEVGFVGSLSGSAERARLIARLCREFQLNEQRFMMLSR